MSHEFMNFALSIKKKNICFLRGSYSWANFSLVDLINVVPKKACFLMLVLNNVQTIGTIIWKHYPDTDHKRPGRTTKTTSIYPVDRDDRVNFEAIMHMETLSADWRTGRSKTIPESEVEEYRYNYSWFPNRSTMIHDSQVFKRIELHDSYMFCNFNDS